MTGSPDFTPTQRRMLAVLRDGREHGRDELAECLDDERTEAGAVRTHLTYLRRKLRPEGMDVVCVLVRAKPMYRMIVDLAWFLAAFPAAQVIHEPAPSRPEVGS